MNTRDKLFRKFKKSRLQIEKQLYNAAQHKEHRPVEIKKIMVRSESLSKIVGQLGSFTKRIVQMKLFKMPRNT